MSDAYTMKGSIELGRGVQEFSREVEAESEEHARDLILSSLTSEHGISRANVSIDEVE
ncbi:MAG: 50S ribosomal protein L18Ae [Candidatus Nanohaloarchaeota archaeon QJJ-7]|nr:50S ribosomal protein L18Ae [Candidatus Nanohaloarchaeota archaeon QJJ-7]